MELVLSMAQQLDSFSLCTNLLPETAERNDLELGPWFPQYTALVGCEQNRCLPLANLQTSCDSLPVVLFLLEPSEIYIVSIRGYRFLYSKNVFIFPSDYEAL